MTSWEAERLDILGLGLDAAMYHLSWAPEYGWQTDWDSIQGHFTSDPAVASWSADRLDIFGTGDDYAMYHKAWDGSNWSPDWDKLNGSFTSPPTVVSWGPGRLDVFGLGEDAAVWHFSYDTAQGRWQDGWDSLGGGPFTTPPVAVSWGKERLDVFAMTQDGTVWHKAWGGTWSDWESIGNPDGTTSSRTLGEEPTSAPPPLSVSGGGLPGMPSRTAQNTVTVTAGGQPTVTVAVTPTATPSRSCKLDTKDFFFLLFVLLVVSANC